MINGNEKFGAFIVPTGIGASIGGYAGDASIWARKFSKESKLLVNPNVVNAACFSGINENMFYVEGYMIDEFFKGNINILPAQNNKIGVIFDKAIPADVLNIHINTINAVKCIYDLDIINYEVTDENVGVEFFIQDGISVGRVNNVETLKRAAQSIINSGANAIAVVCLFDDSENYNEEYKNSIGVDPVGGVEAIISHYLSKEFRIPVAHAPAFSDYSICTDIVNPKSAAEYITPTYLPCVLLGLANAPLFNGGNISVDNLDYLVMPYDALGSIPVYEAIKRNIPVYAVRENGTSLNVTNDVLHKSSVIHIVNSYQECLNLIGNN